MTARRRKVIIAAAIIATLLALAWALLGRRGRMDVQLVFVGYSNYTTSFSSSASSSQVVTTKLWNALVMATNNGSIPVQLVRSMREGHFIDVAALLRRATYVSPSGTGLPRILKPGETAFVEFGPGEFRQPWYSDLAARRHQLRDRVHEKAWASGDAIVQELASWFTSPPEELWLPVGPISTVVPDTVQVQETP